LVAIKDIAANKGKNIKRENSGTDGVGDGEVELAGIVIVCVLLQPLV